MQYSKSLASSNAPCSACGQLNVNPGIFCESCGNKLAVDQFAGRGTNDAHKSAADRPAQKDSLQRKKKRGKIKGTQIFIGIAPLLVLGALLYGEFSRESVTKPSLPADMAGTTAPRSPEIGRLQNLVDDNPQDHESILRLANLLHDEAIHQRSLLGRAVEAYKKYLAIHPGSENPRVDLGICYFELSKENEDRAPEFVSLALREMETVYKANNSHQAAAFNLGIVHLFAGHTVESNEWFRRAVAIDGGTDLGERAKRLLEQHTFEQPVN